jgi:hypothetical protein
VVSDWWLVTGEEAAEAAIARGGTPPPAAQALSSFLISLFFLRLCASASLRFYSLPISP